jgi:hypothetical protein
MFKYRAVEDWSGLPSHGWTIERFVHKEPPVRMPFRGNRSEAEAEATRLNALARQAKGGSGFPRVPVPVSFQIRAPRGAPVSGQAETAIYRDTPPS